ncbi:MAG: hypothetical protein GY757_59710 [bacterium]|nr:hypothetical protein [bacterium]
MRHFHSYGPVDCDEHFCVDRGELIAECTNLLVGSRGKSGSYFTIWAPRQSGKTWLMHQVKKAIKHKYKERFIVADLSMQGVVLKSSDPEDAFLQKIPKIMLDGFDLDIEAPEAWEEWALYFHKRRGLFDRPVILFIDEFDSLPAKVIDRLVTLFRDMYLKRDGYLLHGLALVGVRAVLGVESERGSPFNIQRALHIPNLTYNETRSLFNQYQSESQQEIEPGVVNSVFTVTRGQPGLVSWFGELLTEKYNPGQKKTLCAKTWATVYSAALHKEWNNTLLNIVKKARSEYRPHIMELFTRPDIPFNLYKERTNYLYLNGIVDHKLIVDEENSKKEVCRFASPFVQACLYGVLTDDLVGDRTPIMALEPLDELADIFDGDRLDTPALLRRYTLYLARLKARGLNPWKDQPRRSDMHFTEAVGHFHLYAWLREAVGRRCVVSPEFPTGNGKVDLHLRCRKGTSVIEVKSFVDAAQIREAKKQAAGYAVGIGLKQVTVAVFVPVDDETVIEKLSDEVLIDGIQVTLVAIAWS